MNISNVAIIGDSSNPITQCENGAPYIGVFDLFKIGIGPSSSHTSGPMIAAAIFIRELDDCAFDKVRVTLLGSLAWTGKGHATDAAVILGLLGSLPNTVDPDRVSNILGAVRREKRLLTPRGLINFDPEQDIIFDTVTTSFGHPNTIRFEALNESGVMLAAQTWFSLGGGFVARDGDIPLEEDLSRRPRFQFDSAKQLLEIARSQKISICDIAYQNELALRADEDIRVGIAEIADAMFACIERGLRASGVLPGGLNVQRRAKAIFEQARELGRSNVMTPTGFLHEISAFAMAVNEENASGGRVVTAPTNGAAGVIPAVLRYYRDFCAGYSIDGVIKFFLIASVIGALVKRRASISGAEVGCQGEVGTAAAMAAAGLCAVLGGSNEQIENAAEIAMEHHLGMTCDPVGGLVQIPCIERNAFGAIKAINAATLALCGDGQHHVSFDQVIETMRQTGADMQSKYKETSRGGLAVNVTAC